MRSWVALSDHARSNTDLVILFEGKEKPCAGEPAGADAQYLRMPADVLASLKATKLNPAAYRMRAFVWWLELPENVAKRYGYVGVLDTDMIFQDDIFDRVHAYDLAQQKQGTDVLHLVAENSAERNDGYTAKRLRGYPGCNRALMSYLTNASILPRLDSGNTDDDLSVVERLEARVEKMRAELAALKKSLTAASAAPGRRLRSRRSSSAASAAVLANATLPPAVQGFWDRFGATHRLNFGSMFGTRRALIGLCNQVVDVLVGPMSTCWDQGMLNVVSWTGLVAAAQPSLRVLVWDCFEGPVKTLDVGALRDANGRFYNERGALYPIVHQFRPTRQSKFVSDLGRIFPPRNASNDRAYHRRVAWQTTLFERPLQRVPFVWDDKRRMERLAAQMKASGLPDPADPARPLPPTLPPCATPSVMYKPAAERDALGGVKGDAWEGMAAGGYVLPPRKAAS